MPQYCVNENAQLTGEHEVHELTCSRLPEVENRISLGECKNCHEAVKKAKDLFKCVDGCYYCSFDCHTR